jgi:hypothetical protein
MSSIKKIKADDRQRQLNKAFKYGAKEGERHNPYRAIKPALKAYKKKRIK